MYVRVLDATERQLPAERRTREIQRGAALSLDEAMDLAAQALGVHQHPPDDVPASDASGLSPREREVLRLMVEGASNDEIAVALNIARRTAAAQHVAAILGKLGASNRTAATTIALRRGLV